MKILFNKLFLEHNPECEFEGAYRIKNFTNLPDTLGTKGAEYLELVHPKKYIQKIKRACECKSTMAEIKLSPVSFKSACLAVDLTVQASEQNNFAVVRPPGHHAKIDQASGFCLFNNIAIATQKLINNGKKVFILDIDGHHGDGTQSIFYKTDKVFFCSIHQDDTFPGSGKPDETGILEGANFSLNIPLPSNSGDQEFLSAVALAIKRAKEFKPDVVAVSTGFDGYTKDKLLNLDYTLEAYYECGKKLKNNFKNIFGVLEGGYHNEVKECLDRFISGINEN